LLDELEALKQSRSRSWIVLQRVRVVLSEPGSVAIPLPAQKTFDAEGEALEHALRKSFCFRNDAIKSLCLDAREAIDAAAFIERHRVSYILRQSLALASPSDSLKGRLPLISGTDH
jgi:hypothetical protein